MTDNVNHPAHYMQGGIECIDALAAATTNLQGLEAVCTANAIKYLWRWKGKNGVEDLKKARWYIDRLIAKLDGINSVGATTEAKCPVCGEWQLGNEIPFQRGYILIKGECVLMPFLAYVSFDGNIYSAYSDDRIPLEEIERWCSVTLNLGGAGDA